MNEMNDLTLMVVMLSSFVVLVYGGHTLARHLRRRGYGPRLDAMHDSTVRTQARILRAIGKIGAARVGSYPPRSAAPPVESPNTKRD